MGNETNRKVPDDHEPRLTPIAAEVGQPMFRSPPLFQADPAEYCR